MADLRNPFGSFSDYQSGRQAVVKPNDFIDNAGKAESLNIVSGLERLEHQYHKTSGEILHRSTERHTYGHTAGSEQRRDGGGIDAQCSDGYDEKQHCQCNRHHARNE